VFPELSFSSPLLLRRPTGFVAAMATAGPIVSGAPHRPSMPCIWRHDRPGARDKAQDRQAIEAANAFSFVVTLYVQGK
jgi:hypothetical protein